MLESFQLWEVVSALWVGKVIYRRNKEKKKKKKMHDTCGGAFPLPSRERRTKRIIKVQIKMI